MKNISALKKIYIAIVILLAGAVTSSNVLTADFSSSHFAPTAYLVHAKKIYHNFMAHLHNLYSHFLSPSTEKCLTRTHSKTAITIAPVKNEITNHGAMYPTFSEWKHACNTLPIYSASSKPTSQTVLHPDMLEQESIRFFHCVSDALKQNRRWVGATPSNKFFDCSQQVFEPYVERLIVNPNSLVAFHGDFHGDVHALNDFIQTWKDYGYIDDNFKITQPNFYIVFLGDYTDRGWYGAEVIYGLLRLKNANHKQVFMVRGNHEDKDINAYYGLKDELIRKFAAKSQTLEQCIYRMYNFLPLALYMGSPSRASDSSIVRVDYIQCCHGGIEIGYNPKALLGAYLNGENVVYGSLYQTVSRLDQLIEYQSIVHLSPSGNYSFGFSNNKRITIGNGFMWSDFSCDYNSFLSNSDRGEGMYEFGRIATTALLDGWSDEFYAIRSIFRGHQHAGPMKDRILNNDGLSHPADAGMGKLWHYHDEPYLLEGVRAVTFSVAPRTGYGYSYDAYGCLDIRDGYEKWRLYVLRDVKKNPDFFSLKNS